MSTNRRGTLDHSTLRDRKGPNGRRLCFGDCGREVPKGRQNWCSQTCVDRWRIVSDPGYARSRVFKRDRGVCVLCFLDTVAFRERVLAMEGQARTLMIEAYGGSGRTTWWDMDHIIPVSMGGGECGLDNLRTLCIPCHKRVTADLARSRAEEYRRWRASIEDRHQFMDLTKVSDYKVERFLEEIPNDFRRKETRRNRHKSRLILVATKDAQRMIEVWAARADFKCYVTTLLEFDKEEAT